LNEIDKKDNVNTHSELCILSPSWKNQIIAVSRKNRKKYPKQKKINFMETSRNGDMKSATANKKQL